MFVLAMWVKVSLGRYSAGIKLKMLLVVQESNLP